MSGNGKSHLSLHEQRAANLESLIKTGIDPYPYKFDTDSTSIEIIELSKNLKNEEVGKEEYKLAGRIKGIRRHGRVTFMDLEDDNGTIQLCFEKGVLENYQYSPLKKFDIGDFIGVEGPAFRTQRGQISLSVDNYTFLAKALRPLPDKREGIKDERTRVREPELVYLSEEKAKDRIRTRAQVLRTIRNHLDSKEFMEADTPTLQELYGGGDARPFVSYSNAYNMELFLGISPEIYLKRLIVSGFNKVYSICKNFRNEGVDRTHNPEFTMLECYAAFSDVRDMMELTEKMIREVCNATNRKDKISYQGEEIDFSKPFRRIKMYDIVNDTTGIDVKNLSYEQIRAEMHKRGIEYVGDKEVSTKGDLVIKLFEKYAEHTLIQPTFVIGYPKESTPFCKPDKEDSELLDRFELFIGGMEVGNAYSELNDPVKQRELLEKQLNPLREKVELQRIMSGFEEFYSDKLPIDEKFLNAMEYGMPPTGGVGIGVDRLVMLMTDSGSIREVIPFPFVKPINSHDKGIHSYGSK